MHFDIDLSSCVTDINKSEWGILTVIMLQTQLAM